LLHARWEIAAPSKLQRLQSCKRGITEKEPVGDKTGVSRENILLETYNIRSNIYSLPLSAATISNISGNHHNKNTNSLQETSQTSSQSVQAKKVNSNAMDEMFAACTMVQQIITDLSGAATEEEKVVIIIKPCLDC
jgi:hypothetical protein